MTFKRQGNVFNQLCLVTYTRDRQFRKKELRSIVILHTAQAKWRIPYQAHRTWDSSSAYRPRSEWQSCHSEWNEVKWRISTNRAWEIPHTQPIGFGSEWHVCHSDDRKGGRISWIGALRERCFTTVQHDKVFFLGFLNAFGMKSEWEQKRGAL